MSSTGCKCKRCKIEQEMSDAKNDTSLKPGERQELLRDLRADWLKADYCPNRRREVDAEGDGGGNPAGPGPALPGADGEGPQDRPKPKKKWKHKTQTNINPEQVVQQKQKALHKQLAAKLLRAADILVNDPTTVQKSKPFKPVEDNDDEEQEEE